VSTAELQQFFAEIESIAYRSKIRVLLWDHAFQGYATYRKGDWKNFKINGRAGPIWRLL
jgi:predicted metal-dependent peptidase